MMPGMRASMPYMAISSPAWGFIYYGFARLSARTKIHSPDGTPLYRHTVREEFGFLKLNHNQIASTWLFSPPRVVPTVIPIHNLASRSVAVALDVTLSPAPYRSLL